MAWGPTEVDTSIKAALEAGDGGVCRRQALGPAVPRSLLWATACWF